MENDLADIIAKISDAQVAEDVDEQVTLFNQLREVTNSSDYTAIIDHAHSWMSFITLNTPIRLKLTMLEFVIDLLKSPKIPQKSKALVLPSIVGVVNFFLPQVTQPRSVMIKFVQLFTLIHPLGILYMSERPKDDSFSASWLGCRQSILNYLAPLLTDSTLGERRKNEQAVLLAVIRCLVVMLCAETKASLASSETVSAEEVNIDLLPKDNPLRAQLKAYTEILLGALLTVIVTPTLSLSCRTAGLNASFFLLHRRPYLFPKFLPIFDKSYNMVLGTLQAKPIFHTLRAGLFAFSKSALGAQFASAANELLYKVDRNLSAWREELLRQVKLEKAQQLADEAEEYDSMNSKSSVKKRSRAVDDGSRGATDLKRSKKEPTVDSPATVHLPLVPLLNTYAIESIPPETLKKLSHMDPCTYWLLKIPKLDPSVVAEILLQFLVSPQSQLPPPKNLATVLPALMPPMLPLLEATFGNGPYLNHLAPLLSSGFSVPGVLELLPHLQQAVTQSSPLGPMVENFRSRRLLVGSVEESRVALPSTATPKVEIEELVNDTNVKDMEELSEQEDAEDLEASNATEAMNFKEFYSFLVGGTEYTETETREMQRDLYRRIEERLHTIFGRAAFRLEPGVRECLSKQSKVSVLAAHDSWSMLLARLASYTVSSHTFSGTKVEGADSVLIEDFTKWFVTLNPPPLEVGLYLLFELYFLHLKERARYLRFRESKESSAAVLEVYVKMRNFFVNQILEKFADKPKLLPKFLVELPKLDWGFVESLLNEKLADKKVVIMVILKDLLLNCSAVSRQALDALLSYSVAEDTKFRHTAILMVRKLADKFEDEIEKFSCEKLDSLYTAIDAKNSAEPLETVPNSDICDVDGEDTDERGAARAESTSDNVLEDFYEGSDGSKARKVDDNDDTVNTTSKPSPQDSEHLIAQVKQSLDLYFALCHRRIPFLRVMFERAGDWSLEVIKVLKLQLAGLIRSLKEDSELLSLLEDGGLVLRSEHAEELVIRISNLLIQLNGNHASPELIKCLLQTYSGRPLNLNLLTIMAPDMTSEQLDSYFGDLLRLATSSDEGKAVLRQLFVKFCADESKMTPEKILLKLHELAGSPSAPASKEVLKQCIEAIAECLNLPGLFTSTVVLKALTTIVTNNKLSYLFVHTILQFLRKNAGMAASVQFLLRKLVDYKVWKYRALWDGFILLVRRTLPYSLPLLTLHLDVAQFEQIVAKYVDIKPMVLEELKKLPPSARQNQRYKDLAQLLATNE